MRTMIIAALLLSSCSTKELNLNPKMRLRTSESPVNLIEKHEDLASPLTLNFELNYPVSLLAEKYQKERAQILENGMALVIKTIYLLGHTPRPVDVSDYRTSGCKAYKVKKMHLVCGKENDPKSWIPKKNSETLSEFYWSHRFHEDYLFNWSEKFGVFINFIKNRSSDLELVPNENSSYEFNFRISRISLKPNDEFPQFQLKILEQRNPTIELAYAFSYFATKKTEGFLAPITHLSSDFEEMKKKNLVLIKSRQFDELHQNIKALNKNHLLIKHNYCPLNLNMCDYPNRIDFKDEKKVNDYIFDLNLRNHIWGLLLLGHTKLEKISDQPQKAQIKATIDMKALLNSYKIMPTRAYREMIE